MFQFIYNLIKSYPLYSWSVDRMLKDSAVVLISIVSDDNNPSMTNTISSI